MKTMLFYEKPVILNREAHKTLRLSGPADFRFAADTNSVPLAGAEIYDAAMHYPIVFAGPQESDLMPVALLGLQQNRNLFVGGDGRWEGGYLPAFVRGYPFLLARGDAPEEGQGEFLVCIDEAYPGLGSEAGEPLFDEDGKETPVLQRSLDLLLDLQGQMRRTRDFVERLQQLNLLKEMTLQVLPEGGDPLVLQGMRVVDEQRLQALDAAEVEALFRNGELGWIYAHLLSLRNVGALSRRLGTTAARATAA